MGLSALADKTRTVPTKSKDKFCHFKFLFRLLHPHLKIQSRQIPLVPNLIVRPISIVCQRITTPIPGFILSRFENFRIPSCATKGNLYLSGKLISVQLHVCKKKGKMILRKKIAIKNYKYYKYISNKTVGF